MGADVRRTIEVMKFGFVVPWADAEDVGRLAVEAEANGWDGLFVWEPVWGVDAWIALGVAAHRTNTIRLGTMITPPSRRRPWELASQVATVDRLSHGRVVLGVGLGAIDSGFETFGEECDRRTRAELMDECLDVARGLWGGQPFSYEGTHYRVQSTEFPTIGHTEQRPHPPIWCVGALGFEKSMNRALTCDGLLPQVKSPEGEFSLPTLEQIAGLREQIDRDDYDIVIEGHISDHSPDAWKQAGATWWIESMWETTGQDTSVPICIDRLRDGPPA